MNAKRKMTGIQRLMLWLYRCVWVLGLPLVLVYLRARGRRDPAYRLHLGERFGHGPTLAGAVVVHAVSLGEMRSAVPLVRALLERGEQVVTTHLTPAGRRASESAFRPEIAAGQLVARYLPLELGFAWHQFLRAPPKLVLALEIEIWPVMIAELARAGVPLFLANSQYPARSYARDLRFAHRFGHPVAFVSGVLAKSQTHAARFVSLNAPDVTVCGELRFDQPIPQPLLAAARTLLQGVGSGLPARRVVAVTSVVEGEDASYLAIYRSVQDACRARGVAAPLFLHIPRAPERFAAVGALLEAAGQRLLYRSRAFGPELDPVGTPDFGPVDVLLGDSLGEMYFYLALADLVAVGGGFLASGAHNVIEPLALLKPVLVGPNVWSIEYPGVEAVEAGVMQICPTPTAMAEAILAALADPASLAAIGVKASAFFADHSGATARMLAVLAPVLDGEPCH